MIWWLVACSGTPEPHLSDSAAQTGDSGAPVDSASDPDAGVDTGPLDTASLEGTWVEGGGGPPLFSVQNHLDQTRTADDLSGMITVMWFFPAASTYG